MGTETKQTNTPKNRSSLKYTNGKWYRNGKVISNLYNYKFYDYKDKTYKRLLQNGKVIALANGNNYVTKEDINEHIKTLEHKKQNEINSYLNEPFVKVGRFFFGDRFSKDKLKEINDKFINDVDIAKRAYYSKRNTINKQLSNELNVVLKLQHKYPNLGRLARWEFDRNLTDRLMNRPYNANDYYTYKNSEDKVIIPKTAKILAGEAINKQDIRAIKDASKRNNIDYWDLLSISAGETAIGNVQGWSNGDEVSNIAVRVRGRRSKNLGAYSELVHDHIYQTGSDIPAVSELRYASKIGNNYKRFYAPRDIKNISADITEARANKLINDSEEYLKIRGNSLDHIARIWKENHNYLNYYNATVDNGRDYKTKVHDNVKLLKQIEELNPDLYKYGGLIRRRLSNGGKLSE